MIVSVLVALAVAFGAGAALILAASVYPRSRAAALALWPLYGSEFVIVGALLVPAALGAFAFAAALIGFALRGEFEMLRLLDLPCFGVPQAIVALAGAAMIGAATLGDWRLAEIAFAAGAVLALIAALATWRGRAGLMVALGAISCLVFPVLAGASIALLTARNSGFMWLVFAYGTVEIDDAFALLVGRLFGRTPIFPRLSPHKTLEGLAGGITAGMAAGLLLARTLLGVSFSAAFLPVAVVLTAGLAGDIATSALKRRFGKKDFPPVLARHGGVLDIYDSILFAGPALLLCLEAGLR
jgi:CDP-diglyceride synthetase